MRLPERFDDLRVRLGLYLAAVVAVIAVYTAVYHVGMATLEGRPRSLAASLQTVVQSLTTTGYGQDAPWSTDAMNLFAVAMQFTGIFLIFLVLPLFVVPWFEELVQRRRLDAVEPVAGHVVVCRAGAALGGLLDAFDERGIGYVVVEPDRDAALAMHEAGRAVLHGDPEDTGALERAWIEDAAAAVIVGEDREVLNVALAVGDVAPDVRLIATVEHEAMGRHVRYAGADMVLNPKRVLAQGLATRVLAELPGAGDLVEIEHDFTLAEIPVEEGSEAVDREGSEVASREGVRFLGVWRGGSFATDAGSALRAGDNLVVGGVVQDIERVRRDVIPALAEDTPVIVVGHGTVGSEVATVLRNAGAHVTVVDIDDGEAINVVGDATDERVLQEARVEDAEAVVVAVAEDADAVVIALLAREHNPDAEVFVRANDDASLDRLTRAGTDEAVSLAEVTGRLLALNALEGVVALTEAGTAVVRLDAADVDAESVDALGLGDGCALAGIERHGRLERDLDGDVALEPGDDLVLVGDATALEAWRS